ncbi:MAG: AAA family ATPase [Candidatus Binatia bacterium]|nr:AAA family ATPase [Candidatus Binatia bacterium]
MAKRQVVSALRWVEGQPWPRSHWSNIVESWVRVDRDLYVGAGELCWFRVDDLRDLVLQVQHQQRDLVAVTGTFFFRLGNSSLTDRLRRWRLGKRVREFERRRFPTLVSYLVYYPIWWVHETQMGRHPIHAAAVATPRGAIVLAGASGVGKSSISTALAAHPGNYMLSDSFVLVEGTRVFAVPEPILLDHYARDWLATRVECLQPVDHHYMLNRDGYQIAPAKFQPSANAAVLILPQRGHSWGCRKIDAARAWQRITAANFLVNDLRRYYALTAAWEQLEPKGLVIQRERAVEELTQSVAAFEVEIPPTAAAEFVVENLMGLLESQRAPLAKHE